MKSLRQFTAKLAAMLRRDKSERALEKEISAHLALIEEDFRKQGLSTEEARFAARRAFGGVAQTKERYRDQRSFIWLEQCWQDTRHAARSLWKSPGFAIVALLSLAFGIGVNTAIFTLVDRILLKTLPMPDANRLVEIRASLKAFPHPISYFSFPHLRQLRAQTSIFSDVIGSCSLSAILDSGTEPQQVDLDLVTGSYFSFFSAQPALGRLLVEEDDRVEGAHPVCVLSYHAWRSHFGADANILGRVIRIDTIPLEVVGVAGPDFVGAELQKRYDVWAPTALAQAFTKNQRDTPNVIWMRVMAKRRPGITPAEAKARLQAASPGIEAALPKRNVNKGARYEAVDGSKGFDSWRTRLREPLVILMRAVGLVLLIACANLTNLLLARANGRQQEFAVKLSLGISRVRLLRQLLIETLLLTFAGTVAGIAAAHFLVRFLLDLFNAGNRSSTLEVSMDLGVLAFTFGVCAVVTVVVGLYPAWWAMHTDATPALKGATAGGTQKGFVRRLLIVVQISLAVVLLFGASLFSHSLRKLKTADLGYDIDHLVTISLTSNSSKPVTGSPALRDVLSRTRQMPGVESAALSNPGVLSGRSAVGQVETRNAGRAGSKTIDQVFFLFASPEYFSTLRIPLLRGRDFTDSDRKGSPAAVIVNKCLASLISENPLGMHVSGWDVKDLEIVGVVDNSKYQNIRESTEPIAYLALNQAPILGATLDIRTKVPVVAAEASSRVACALHSTRVPHLECIDNGTAP